MILCRGGLSALSILRPLLKRRHGSTGNFFNWSLRGFSFSVRAAFAAAVLIIFSTSLYFKSRWPFAARLVPLTVSISGRYLQLSRAWRDVGKATAAATHVDAKNTNGPGAWLWRPYGSHGLHPRARLFYLDLCRAARRYLVGFVSALVGSTLIFIRFYRAGEMVASARCFVWPVCIYLARVRQARPPKLAGIGDR